jgi:hypothetical protein
MPSDPISESPATVSIGTAAGGHLTLVAYAWQHPDDGPQDGLLVISSAGEGDAVAATWGDSWHQKPEAMSLSGTRTAAGSVSLEGSYFGDWGWRILLDPGAAGELLMRMDNVIPASHAAADKPAGPYPVMLLQARRA